MLFFSFRFMDTSRFPPSFLHFIHINSINIKEYQHNIPRYFRKLGPCNIPNEKETMLPGFFSIPHDQKVANCVEYTKGLIFGMDLASGLAIEALEIEPNDQILDVCAAPGTKLCYISHLLGTGGVGTVTGVYR